MLLMFMWRNKMKKIAMLLLVLSVATLLFIPLASENSEATTSDIVIPSIDDVVMRANDVDSVFIIVHNRGTESYSVLLDAQTPGDCKVTFKTNNFTLMPGKHKEIELEISSDQYLDHIVKGTIAIGVSLYSPAYGLETSDNIASFSIEVDSAYSSADHYNKILGIFDSPLSAPMNAPLVTLGISIVLWIIIAVLIVLVIMSIAKVILMGIRNNHLEEEGNYNSLKSVKKFIFGIIALYAISSCLSIIGADFEIVSMFSRIATLLNVWLTAIIFWKIYKSAITKVIGSREKGFFNSSILPLVMIASEIMMILIVFVTTLATLGISVGIVIAVLGLVATGISLGAKNVIGQFISGLLILSMRPFVKDDKIKVGDSTRTLEVREIGFMTTSFKNWTNEEIIIYPNSTIMDSKITNITRDNYQYVVYDFFSIAMTEDIQKAREIMVDVANSHPNVISDGTFKKPEVRVTDVDRDGVILRISYTVIDHEDYGTTGGEIRKEIYNRFNEEGIEIPYKQIEANIIRD